MFDAYVFDHVRTPRGKGKKDGGLHQASPVWLLRTLLQALQARQQLDTELVDDVVLGCVTPVGEQGSDIARTAVLDAGWAQSVGGVTQSRFCASGLESVNLAAAKVASGFERLVVAGGVESMSRWPMGSDGGAWFMDPRVNQALGFIPQGISADLIATLEGWGRDEVDAFAAESHRRAAAAREQGLFARSLVPVHDIAGLPMLAQDETIRPQTTPQTLAKLDPSFAMMGAMGFDATALRKYTTVERIEHVHHAGNSSGIVDGAALMLIGSREAMLGLITPTTRYEDLAGCDLIVEAVFEDRAVKAAVTQQAEAVIGADTVFASNTSTLPITGLAGASSRPAQFLGLHFFSPVDKMPLVEIIVGAHTSDETLARGFDYVLQIGKTPIVVNDARGFYTSRVFATYVMEGIAMLKEGVHPRSIEVAALQAGMPMPPLALQDELSLSLGVHVADQTRKDLAAEGKPYHEHPGESVLRQLCEIGRVGKKAGGGFYDWADGGKTLWPELGRLFPLATQQPAQQELIDRMMFAQANEAARCLQEGVLRSVADANIGSIFGWGFAPFQGGALQFINAYGLPAFVARSRELAAAHGERFAPAQSLVDMALRGESFPTQ